MKNLSRFLAPSIFVLVVFAMSNNFASANDNSTNRLRSQESQENFFSMKEELDDNRQECRDRCFGSYYECMNNGGYDDKAIAANCESYKNSCLNTMCP